MSHVAVRPETGKLLYPGPEPDINGGGEMIIRRLLPLALLIMLPAPVGALAGTYQWTDAAGVLHFTDNPEQIPAKYHKRVRELPSISKEQQGSGSPDVGASPAPSNEVREPLPGENGGAFRGEYGALTRELKKLQDTLPGKKEELTQLHRKWTILKGKTPTPDEIAAFEKKRAQGAVSVEDNPYVNKNPLTSPGLGREAYYKKVEEIRQDEERIGRIQQRLGSLEREANMTGEPATKK